MEQVHELQRLREERGMSAYELAKRADIGIAYVRRLERCMQDNPTIKVLWKLSEALDVDIIVLANIFK